VIALPPLEAGGEKERVANESPALALNPLGAPGKVLLGGGVIAVGLLLAPPPQPMSVAKSAMAPMTVAWFFFIVNSKMRCGE
jgi:hypothetical protein